MEKVTGIGGVFFRTRDPKAIADWYKTHLGISGIPDNYDDPPWQQQAGPTAFARSRKTQNISAIPTSSGC